MEPLINPGVHIAPVAQGSTESPQELAQAQPVVQSVATNTPSPSTSSGIKKVIVSFLIISLISGVGYAAYVFKDTIKGYMPYLGDDVMYTEANFVSSLINKFTAINSAEYTFSTNIYIVDREKGVVSMDSKVIPDPKRVEGYNNDYNKIQAISNLFGIVAYSYNKYPKDLSELKKEYNDRYGKYRSSSSENILGNKDIMDVISYRVIHGGQDFELSIELETEEAITAMKDANARYAYGDSISTSTLFNGKKVTFTKNSNSYLYIPQEMKKPLLAEFGYYLKELPQEFNIHGTSTILSKITDNAGAEIKTGLTAMGDFSDLSYKLSFETILKDNVFYYHINNFPALGLLGGLSVLKGKWIKVDMKNNATTSYENDSDMIGNVSLGVQKSIEENKEKTKSTLLALAKSADVSHLITFIQNPVHEKLRGKNVTKYQFFVNKDEVSTFLDAFEKELAGDDEMLKSLQSFKSEIETVLASPDFNEIYEYSKSNIFLTIWTKQDGTPVEAEVRLRVVPSVESKNLQNKQIEVIFRMSLSKINEAVNIEVPKDAKSYKEVMGTSTRDIW